MADHNPRDSVKISISKDDRERISKEEREARRASALHALTSSSSSSTTTPLPPLVSVEDSSVIIAEKAGITGTLPAFAQAVLRDGDGDGEKKSYELKLASNVVIHPFARVSKSTGPVSLGKGVVVFEMASVGLLEAASGVSSRSSMVDLEGKGGSITVGEGVSISAHAVVRAPCTIGAHSSVGVRAILEAGTSVGAWCRIGDGVVLAAGTSVPDGMIVFFDSMAGRNVWRRNGGVVSTWMGEGMGGGMEEGKGKGVGPERVKELMVLGHDMVVQSGRRTVKGNLVKWTSMAA